MPIRNYCIKAIKSKTQSHPDAVIKTLGQPTLQTHPHLLKENEITPNLSKNEYQTRRHKFAELISRYAKENRRTIKNHLVKIFYIL